MSHRSISTGLSLSLGILCAAALTSQAPSRDLTRASLELCVVSQNLLLRQHREFYSTNDPMAFYAKRAFLGKVTWRF
jgi:hypothetical protein